MKKILIAGCSLKEQYRIKSFLEKDFLVEANPSVHNCVPNIRDQKYDMILFDTDNVVPLKVFMSEIQRFKSKTPVSALISFSDLNKIKRLQTLGVVSIVKKPCNKKRLIGGINKGFYYFERLQAKQKINKPKYTLIKNESDILICLKKHAVLTQIRKTGLDLLLPTSLEKGTKLLFRSPALYAQIGLTFEKPPRVNLEIESCIPIDDYQYKVIANFDFKDQSCQNFFNCLHRHIDQHAFKPGSVTDPKTILIAEPDLFTREFYQVALQNKGYRLLFAFDGIQTLDTLDQQKIDMLVMDLLLPRLNGQEVLEIMSKRKVKTPVVIATGESNPEIVQEVKPYVLGYMVKPVTGKSLSDGIATVFNSLNGSFSNELEADPSMQIDSDIELMVAFQEHVKILELADNGLVFARHNPIVPGTIILIKTDAISTEKEGSVTDSSAIEMGVTRCQHQKDGRYFNVQATFNTAASSFQ
jgi:two-component system OmpR family response regulator